MYIAKVFVDRTENAFFSVHQCTEKNYLKYILKVLHYKTIYEIKRDLPKH